MVRVPGSLGASGYHRESPDEEAQAKIGLGNEAPTDIGSPLTSLNQEGGLATNLEEKPQPPAKVPSGTAAGSNSHQNPLDESPLAKAGNVSSKQPPSSRSTVKKKPARSKSSRKKLKAPDSTIDGPVDLTSAWTDEQLENVYQKK
ncbi:hypothetical protein PPTG_00679 [Phytophthora nicotianae INRA-310]|uniref:Uncharacterized protein n=1 Tax=Phytophthora nicotianae (strain INRA-310) TaxID=761204 RepID=W2RIA0_PHYN3|nr:hypothetical protein PPTG_00679 [Phytophthora nicotianae INRA-310]ETN24285.1 hypothetical protein PPTG_00679 [Phytophthora nicotianae INRA-310]